jgi:hypothetical protein
MTVEALKGALKGVDWEVSIDAFLGQADSISALDDACTRIAVWSGQFESADKGNPALAYVRSIQASAHEVVAACALSLYGAAAASIRNVVEGGLYYTYFRHHLAELTTITRDASYFVSRADVVSFHKVHTVNFKGLQELFGFLSKLEVWYGQISATVHGQLPGVWIAHSGLDEIKPSTKILKLVVGEFCRGEELLHELFLLTAGRQMWDRFSTPAKKALLKGLDGKIRTALGLDKA